MRYIPYSTLAFVLFVCVGCGSSEPEVVVPAPKNEPAKALIQEAPLPDAIKQRALEGNANGQAEGDALRRAAQAQGHGH
jgi:hypothetical protein